MGVDEEVPTQSPDSPKWASNSCELIPVGNSLTKRAAELHRFADQRIKFEPEIVSIGAYGNSLKKREAELHRFADHLFKWLDLPQIVGVGKPGVGVDVEACWIAGSEVNCIFSVDAEVFGRIEDALFLREPRKQHIFPRRYAHIQPLEVRTAELRIVGDLRHSHISADCVLIQPPKETIAELRIVGFRQLRHLDISADCVLIQPPKETIAELNLLKAYYPPLNYETHKKIQNRRSSQHCTDPDDNGIQQPYQFKKMGIQQSYQLKQKKIGINPPNVGGFPLDHLYDLYGKEKKRVEFAKGKSIISTLLRPLERYSIIGTLGQLYNQWKKQQARGTDGKGKLFKQQPYPLKDLISRRKYVDGCCKEVRICNHPEEVTNQQIVKKRANWVLLIAALLVATTFQVPFRFLGSSITSEDEEGHFQMSKKQDSRWFLLLNSTVFNASVGLVLFLLQKFPMKPWPQILVLAMFGSFAFSTKALLPNESPVLLFMSFASGLFSATAAKLCMI